MHYYQFNIGDYTSHTKHLSLIEDAIYRRLLDLYYLHEQPLDECPTVVARLINARGHEKKVAAILQEFFSPAGGGGWVSERGQQEIERYHHKIEAASRAGKVSAQRRSNERSTVVQPTNNHKPLTNKQIKTIGADAPCEVEAKVWEDFLAIRKAKRSPLTSTALEAIKREANKAGWTLNQAITECVARGWQGFKAEWVNKAQGKPEKFDPFAFVNKGREQHVVIDITPGQ